MNKRKDYYAEYYKNNQDDIKRRKNLVYQEKRVLKQLDRYFVSLEQLGDIGSEEREIFAAKEIARKIGCDYELVLQVFLEFMAIAGSIGCPKETMEYINNHDALLSKLYKYFSTKPQFSDYKNKLIALYQYIEQSHANGMKLNIKRY